jgi:RimJ/RimL family protein N-acetyltransferase
MGNGAVETRRILLRPIVESDLPVLCEWRNSAIFLENSSNRRNHVTVEEFALELKKDFGRDRHEQFIIELRRSRKPIGTIYSYNFLPADGYAFVTTFLVDDFRGNGYGAEAFAVFLYHLFTTHDLYKVYADIYSYNVDSLRTMQSAKFAEEGRFRGQRLYGGVRHDVIRYAIFRDDLPRIRSFLERCGSMFDGVT